MSGQDTQEAIARKTAANRAQDRSHHPWQERNAVLCLPYLGDDDYETGSISGERASHRNGRDNGLREDESWASRAASHGRSQCHPIDRGRS